MVCVCLYKSWLAEKLVCVEAGAGKSSFVQELVDVKGGVWKSEFVYIKAGLSVKAGWC